MTSVPLRAIICGQVLNEFNSSLKGIIFLFFLFCLKVRNFYLNVYTLSIDALVTCLS